MANNGDDLLFCVDNSGIDFIQTYDLAIISTEDPALRRIDCARKCHTGKFVWYMQQISKEWNLWDAFRKAASYALDISLIVFNRAEKGYSNSRNAADACSQEMVCDSNDSSQSAAQICLQHIAFQSRSEERDSNTNNATQCILWSNFFWKQQRLEKFHTKLATNKEHWQTKEQPVGQV